MKGVISYLFMLSLCLVSKGQIHNAELLLQKTNISVENGKLTTTRSFELRINNRDGEKYCKISIPYSKMDKVSKIEACVKNSEGLIIKKVQKNDIVVKSAIDDNSLYEDNFIKEFTLKHNVYPYTLCYSYEESEEEFISLENWIPVIDLDVPTLNAVLNVEVPRGYKISYRNYNIDSCKTDSTALIVKYRWLASYKKTIEPEIYGPETVTFVPHVRIVPAEFKYAESGSTGSWNKLGEWEYSIIKNLSDLPQSEKNAILLLINGITDEKEKIRILYHYLQDHTRYINVTIETGGLKPYPASYVSENKYGDCKALTNYFKSVLDVAGIKSFYTNVYGDDVIKEIDKSFPSQQFNHVILCVPVKSDTLWLDCTSDMAFNYLGTFTQARDVLIIDKGSSHLARTPGLSPADVKESRRVIFSQEDQDQTIAKFSNIYCGDKYETYFSMLNTENESDRAQYIRNYVIKNGFEMIDYLLVPPPRDTAKISFCYTARSTMVYKTYGNDIIIKVLPFSIPKFEEPKKRLQPVQINYPIYKIDTLEYGLPETFRLTSLPANQAVNTEFGTFSSRFVPKGNKVVVIKSFLLNPGTYPLIKYQSFYEFITKVIEIEKNSVIVTNKKM